MTDILSDKYKRSGVIAAIIFMIVVGVLLLILGMKIPDPPLEEEELEVEVPIEMSGGSSAGSPSETTSENTSNTQPTKEINTQEDESTSVPSSTGQNTSENTTPAQEADESMMMGDSDGEGDSDGNGDGRLGSGDGGELGNFSGPSKGSSGRTMLVGPTNDKLDKDKRGTIYLELIVNKDGKVLSIEYYAPKSTSQDPELIAHAKKMCRRVKFESSSRTTTEIVGPFIFTPK